MADCTCADPTAVAKAIRGDSENASLVGATSTEGPIDETLYGKNQGGTHGNFAKLRFCDYIAPQVSAIGDSAWATAQKVAMVAIALANAIAQAKIAELQQDLGERYYDMAKYKWDRFEQNYMPLEKKLLLEVSTEPIRELDCDDCTARAVGAVNTAYGTVNNLASRYAKQLRLCVDDSLMNLLDSTQSRALVDTINYNLQDDQFFTDYKNDQRWNRRSNMLNLGRNLTSNALKYGDVATSMASKLGGLIDRAAGTLAGAIGYYGARNDTYYPTTFLSSGSVLGNPNNNLISYQSSGVPAGSSSFHSSSLLTDTTPRVGAR